MTVQQVLEVAELAETLLASDEVAQAWERPSALEGYTVAGLAGHLARAVLTLERYLDEPVADAPPTDAAGYLVAVLGAHDPIGSDLHRTVRQRGDDEAAEGQAALVERLAAARRTLTARLADEDLQRPIAVLAGTVLPIEAYLETRLVELVLHLDDLAVSVGRDDAADVPDAAVESVARVLATLAARRVGGLPTIRSLARRERQPDPVRAL